MKDLPQKYELYRTPLFGDYGDRRNGRLVGVPVPSGRAVVIFSDGGEWDHVSVSFHDRTPTWDDMCFVKDVFFDAEECVVQFHPPKSQYRNMHPFCLHLWRSHLHVFPLPDPIFVAPSIFTKK